MTSPYVVGVQENLFAVALRFFRPAGASLSSAPLPLGEVVAFLTRGLEAELRPLVVEPYTPAPSAAGRLRDDAARIEREGFAIATSAVDGAIVFGRRCGEAVTELGLVCRSADVRPIPFEEAQREQIVENLRALGRRFELEIWPDPLDWTEDEEDRPVPVRLADRADLHEILFDE